LGERGNVEDVSFDENRLNSQGHWAVEPADDYVDAFIHQVISRGDGVAGCALVIARYDFDLPAEDSTGLVELVCLDLHRFECAFPVGAERPAQRIEYSDGDRTVAGCSTTAILGIGASGRQQESDRGHAQNASSCLL